MGAEKSRGDGDPAPKLAFSGACLGAAVRPTSEAHEKDDHLNLATVAGGQGLSHSGETEEEEVIV